MKVYDISQELFGCVVFPGDPAPEKKVLNQMEAGDAINLTAFSMCSHNGTHVDAPSHFIKNGLTVDKMDINKLVGYAYVAEYSGTLSREDAEAIVNKAKCANPECFRRILLKGNMTVSAQAAKAFVEQGVWLVGNHSQTVGPEDTPKAVHMILLGAEVVLLEGIRLDGVAEGAYLLCSAPINLGGCEGAPCRAVLIEP